MVKKKHGVIIETPMEARQAEPGPSILLLLLVSMGIAVAAIAAIWFVFLPNIEEVPARHDFWWKRLMVALDRDLTKQPWFRNS